MDKVKKELKAALQQAVTAIGIQVLPADIKIERPLDANHGDLATNLPLVLAKQAGLNPMEVAQKLATELQGFAGADLIKHVEAAAPGFVNFVISDQWLINSIVLNTADKKELTQIGLLAGKRVLVEHTSPNPNKEFHLGHLKNNVTGLAISYILAAAGAEVFRDCIDNNRGTAIIKLMWGYLRFGAKEAGLSPDVHYWFENQAKWHTPETIGLKPDRFMDQMYAKATVEILENPDFDKQIREMLLDWEAEEPHTWALWRLTQDWVWQGYRRSIGRVNGFKFDKIWHEHEIYKQGKQYVQRGVEMGIFKRTEDGAIVTNLKDEFGLSDTVLLRGDGTSLYITQDIELTSLKRKEFNPDQMCWVIGPEQSLAMKQMFAVCSQLGLGKYEDFHHLPYGFVSVKDSSGKVSKMSSRKGTAVYVDDLIDTAKEKVKTYLSPELTDDARRDEVAEKVAIGAIKYSLLKVGRTTDQVFDIDSSVSLEGESAPYIMYAYARAGALLRKAPENKQKQAALGVRIHSVERSLILQVLSLPEAIENAAKQYSPNLICNYVFELAQLFNNFYAQLSVLNEPEEQVKEFRLMLTSAVKQCLGQGLDMLGIEPLESM